MADRTRDIWNDDDGEERASGQKHRGLKRFGLFLLTLVLVLGLVVVAAYRDGTGFDVLRRYLSYGRVEQAGGGTVFDYDAAADNRFAVLGERLVVLSATALRILDAESGEVWSIPVHMDAPALAVGGGRAVAYDVGGHSLYLIDQAGLLMNLTAQEEEPFISATLNEDGWLAVTAEKQKYKACVDVYDKDLEHIFYFNSSRRFVSDAYVTDDGGYLAAVTLGQERGVFVSDVVLYDLTTPGEVEEPAANFSIPDGLVAAIGQQGGRLAAVSDTCLSFADPDGTDVAFYPYGDSYLRDLDLGGEDFTAVLLNRYQTGSVGRLVTVGGDGTELGSLDVNQEILSMSAAGRYLAVLYMDTLVIYNRELQVYASLRGTDYARSVLMRPDGSALLLSSEAATLFLP